MSDVTQHPQLHLFRRALDAGRVEKYLAENFDRWRQGPKCNADPELRAAADALWERMLAAGGPLPPTRPQPAQIQPSSSARSGHSSAGSGSATPASAAAPPSGLAHPFHNPYTFLPFGATPKRDIPTPLTADEQDRDRFTGIIELELVTCSPLLTCSPEPVERHADHKQYRALCIGNDVIVPATGIRGALRTLMTILTGGTLGYLDEEVWLCQGRDLNLGPAGQNSPQTTPKSVFLAEVVRPGSITRPGSLRLGETRLIPAEKLERAARPDASRFLPRPIAGRNAQHLYSDEKGDSLTNTADAARPWRVKLSGRPVNMKGKQEGLFLPNGPIIDDVPASLWSAYQGRNVHGDHPELRAGDLVWLEAQPGKASITKVEDIASLQWARWGRRGERLLDVVKQKHPQVLPDSINRDGKVDEVTDLFGQVPRPDLTGEAFPGWKGATTEHPGPAHSFAARVRPENLVFADAAAAASADSAAEGGLIRSVSLAPLAPPHPGCAAFYRDQDEPTMVANGRTGLRGYKVYRNTQQRGDEAPWHFAQQAVYDDRGAPKPAQQKVNKTVDLLKEGRTGTLRIACRSLSRREVALLLTACSVDWRLGGGKPLGLGHCRVTRLRLIDETGEEVSAMVRDGIAPAQLPDAYATEVDADLAHRVRLWQASQEPVEFLRYPRAVVENRNKKNRGGHVWFNRHANPRKIMAGDGLPDGLEFMHIDGALAARVGRRSIAPQVLPRLDPDDSSADVLYGYDLFVGQDAEWAEQARNRQTLIKKIEAFDPISHVREQDRSGGGQGQNRDRRQQGRDER